MSTVPMVGASLLVTTIPRASIVVPWGMDAMPATVLPSFGIVVAGTPSQMPGSKWMPVDCPGLVMSLIDWI